LVRINYCHVRPRSQDDLPLQMLSGAKVPTLEELGTLAAKIPKYSAWSLLKANLLCGVLEETSSLDF